MMSLLAGVFAGVGMLFGGLFGMHSSASMMGSTTPTMEHHMGSATTTPGDMRKTPPALAGIVSSVDGTTLTISVIKHSSENATSTLSFTIDASSAKIFKPASKGEATSTSMSVSDIAIGDRIIAIGTISGSTMTAKTVVDGVPALNKIMRPGAGMGMGSSTMAHMRGSMHHMGMGSTTSGT